MAENEELSEIEQIRLDAILLDIAFNNAYLLLSDKITFDDLMTQEFANDGELVMAYDPDMGPKLDELKGIIAYFEDLEEYEKCAHLRDILNKRYPGSINL
tara:strand:+ start:1576 stop:1875 length:300 start_codon:yes stop_codon:yes gene_type:complete